MGFWDFLWLLIWGFFFVLYLMVLFQIIVDIFRDDGMNGWIKALWLVALFIIPVLTALVYIIARGGGMNEREQNRVARAQSATDDYIRSVATQADPTAQISRAKSLLDSGAISADEYAALKAKALS